MKVSPLTGEQQAQSCWALANSYYLAASRLLKDEGRAETLRPTLFLLLHALELHLKAFLFAQGATDKQLRNLSHDLLKCLSACRERGLLNYVSFTWCEFMLIARVNRYYKCKELEYFVPRAKSFGSVEKLNDVVARLSMSLRDPITEKTFRALAQAT